MRLSKGLLSGWLIFNGFTSSGLGVDLMAAVVTVYVLLGWLLSVVWRAVKHRRQCGNGRLLLREAVWVLGIVWIAQSGVFALLRFTLSLPSLNTYAVAAAQDPQALQTQPPSRFRLGLYTIAETQWLPEGAIRLVTGSDGLFNSAGLMWLPQAMPTPHSETRYRHIVGPWWLWIESW